MQHVIDEMDCSTHKMSHNDVANYGVQLKQNCYHEESQWIHSQIRIICGTWMSYTSHTFNSISISWTTEQHINNPDTQVFPHHGYEANFSIYNKLCGCITSSCTLCNKQEIIMSLVMVTQLIQLQHTLLLSWFFLV